MNGKRILLEIDQSQNEALFVRLDEDPSDPWRGSWEHCSVDKLKTEFRNFWVSFDPVTKIHLYDEDAQKKKIESEGKKS